MAKHHEEARRAITVLRGALRKMDIKDPQFSSLLDYHSRRIENIARDVQEHEERNP